MISGANEAERVERPWLGKVIAAGSGRLNNHVQIEVGGLDAGPAA
jgi:hypothetical protein